MPTDPGSAVEHPRSRPAAAQPTLYCSSAPPPAAQAHPDRNPYLERDQVQQVVFRNQEHIRRCNPRLDPGEVVVTWRIALDGTVSMACIQRRTTLSDAPVLTCIRDRIRAWTFDRPAGGEVEVTFPFVFRAEPPSS